jgi:hypothetical protein
MVTISQGIKSDMKHQQCTLGQLLMHQSSLLGEKEHEYTAMV